MDEKVKISILLEIYGRLLTEKQYQYMNDYYNEDLSLSEIAENEDITRQAVMRILQKTVKKLEEYEEKLKILEKELKIKHQVDELKKQIQDNNNIKNIEKILDI
jgi:hypothetical protein